jgi:hypothetical protein
MVGRRVWMHCRGWSCMASQARIPSLTATHTTTISCNQTRHDHFTLTHSQCAHFRVLHLCIHVPFYKCTQSSYNGTEPNRTLEEYSTTPPTKIIMHYKPSEPC